MSDDIAPAWAGALVDAINEARQRGDAFRTLIEDIGDRLDRIADTMEKTDDERKKLDATLDRIGRALDGRGE